MACPHGLTSLHRAALRGYDSVLETLLGGSISSSGLVDASSPLVAVDTTSKRGQVSLTLVTLYCLHLV